MQRNFQQVIWNGLGNKMTIPLHYVKSDEQAQAITLIMFFCDDRFFMLDEVPYDNGKLQIKLKEIAIDEKGHRYERTAYMIESC